MCDLKSHIRTSAYSGAFEFSSRFSSLYCKFSRTVSLLSGFKQRKTTILQLSTNRLGWNVRSFHVLPLKSSTSLNLIMQLFVPKAKLKQDRSWSCDINIQHWIDNRSGRLALVMTRAETSFHCYLIACQNKEETHIILWTTRNRSHFAIPLLFNTVHTILTRSLMKKNHQHV